MQIICAKVSLRSRGAPPIVGGGVLANKGLGFEVHKSVRAPPAPQAILATQASGHLSPNATDTSQLEPKPVEDRY